MKTLAIRSALTKGILLACLVAAPVTVTAVVFDNGVDSENLGKGDWIWYVSQATNKLGGNVASVTNIPSLMSYYQSKGIKWIVAKAGDGSTNFPSASPQFTTTLVTEAHNKGLKIFGYTRSYGVNIPGEIAIATNALYKGADGYIIDAEAEWEPLANRASLATQLCSGIKAAYPTRFLAHCPLPIISLHTAFPYKEFGMGCDAVMPQDYWMDLGKTPAAMVDWMDTEWRNWHNSLTGADRAAIKPLIPVGQAYAVSPQTYTNGHIATFFSSLKNDAKAVTPGGYRGVSFWRADLHSAAMWTEIGTNSIGGSAPGDGSIIIDNPAAAAVGTWSTGTSSTDKYGADYKYIGLGTGANYYQYTPSITVPGNYSVYTWASQGSNRSTNTPHVVTYNGGSSTLWVNQQINGGQWRLLGQFNFATGTAGNVRITDGFTTSGQIAMADAIKFVPPVADIIVDNPAAYLTGSWTLATTSTDKYGADYRWKAPGTGTAWADFIPNIPVKGQYQVYEWHCQGSNRTTTAPWTIYGDGDPVTVNVNQTVSGGQWVLLGTFKFQLGTANTIRLKDNSGNGSVVVADAIKLVFVSQ